ncbi:MAG: uracil-DNA glycosylase [Gammaproteobacteria bacterium]|nr:uracil-DNA glycosylase [Gammaproteobacteria bacterium]NIR97601.1 uracil-DNA glycosylase [Gammaproteobacteria bacterium]NIT63251.1 uracil-DNA glycosylase [Gammaproteobacteria bacterium]NIV20183.1 uracil-DNA glycosylase [Gammaproteobacteria bacterium]NIY31831.1 uracil-DNA glycosylase [Gammaproteobacteria bacterium]
MDEATRQAYLAAMGMQTWEAREPRPPQAPGSGLAGAEGPADAGIRADGVAGLDWTALRERVSACAACELRATRTQTVFGVGDVNARLMLIGEAPGADEDRQGEPFVGRAGQLLNEMLLAIGLRRERVYIANILKCRPPNNRDPQPGEVASCEPFLRRQVELVAPRLIMALGRVAAHNLLKTQVSLARLRGQCHSYGDREVPVLVTYHPAYLLRSPRDKRKAWQDLLHARRMMSS